METVQYVANEAGVGVAMATVAIVVSIWLFKIAWSGTLSEDAQRRNHKRDKEDRK